METSSASQWTADLIAAVGMAEANFPSGHEPASYALVSAQRLLAGGAHCETTRCWRLTFKLASLIPEDVDQIIGAGGEIFFVADVGKGTIVLTGFGE